jgi:hypothetical protein
LTVPFGALKLHLEPWTADRSRRRGRKEKAAAVAACSYCDERGHIFLRNREGAFAAMPCPHDIERIAALEEERGLRRI